MLSEHLPQIRYRPPQATYLSWLDCRDLGLGDNPAEVFMSRGKVALNSGLDFGVEGTGYVRLNFATSPEMLAMIVERMASAV